MDLSNLRIMVSTESRSVPRKFLVEERSDVLEATKGLLLISEGGQAGRSK